MSPRARSRPRSAGSLGAEICFSEAETGATPARSPTRPPNSRLPYGWPGGGAGRCCFRLSGTNNPYSNAIVTRPASGRLTWRLSASDPATSLFSPLRRITTVARALTEAPCCCGWAGSGVWATTAASAKGKAKLIGDGERPIHFCRNGPEFRVPSRDRPGQKINALLSACSPQPPLLRARSYPPGAAQPPR
jgi:hypothetical protein